MAKILLTGFGAFGNTPIDPAECVARELNGTLVDGSKILARIVPNVLFECIDFMLASISEVRPDIVIMMGE
jgi:pyroglutamyl-peptidase